MSPEQAVGEEVDHRTDVYSLGVLAYEMLSGKVPFGATTPHAVLHQLVYDPPPSILSQRPDLPVAVDQVLGRALAKEPVSRHERVSDFVIALEQALSGRPRPAGASSRGLVPAPEKPAPQAVREEPAPAVGAGPKAGRWALWLGWLLASAVGWAVGRTVGGPLSEIIVQVLAGTWEPFVVELVGGFAAWATLGLATGMTQWLVLRQYVRGAGWWVPITTVAYGALGSLKFFQGPATDTLIFETIGWADMMGLVVVAPLIGIGISMILEGLTGLAIGLAQSLVLGRWAVRSGSWGLVTALAWAVGGATMGAVFWLLGWPDDELGMWLNTFFGGIVPGAVTATGLVWILSSRRASVKVLVQEAGV
jgi:hypothetical protein